MTDSLRFEVNAEGARFHCEWHFDGTVEMFSSGPFPLAEVKNALADLRQGKNCSMTSTAGDEQLELKRRGDGDFDLTFRQGTNGIVIIGIQFEVHDFPPLP